MKKNKIIMIAAVLALLIVTGLAGYFWWSAQQLKTVGYQAVFLSNGQVYFGQVTHKNSRYITLTDIFYLQASNPLQSGDQKEEEKASDVSLVKLGKEMHGPKDEMQINRGHILFIEDLTDDSKVVKAIEDYKLKQ